jgi:hypothetical protein
MMSDTTTRAERLAWTPEEALRRADDTPSELGTAALALVEQIEAAGLPIDALDLSIVDWSRALDDLLPGPLTIDVLAKLDADLELERSAAPMMARWSAALRARLVTTQDLERAIAFLAQARSTFAALLAMRR